MKKALYTLFAQYGTVLEIVAVKTYSLRGQAWVVFDSTTEASTAMQKLNGSMFYEKPLVRDPFSSSCRFNHSPQAKRIQFSADRSDKITEREGVPINKEERKSLKRKKREAEMEERAKKRRATATVRADNNAPNKLLLVQNIPALDPKIIHDMLQTLFSQ